MARTGSVAAVVLGTLLALTQLEATLASPVSTSVVTSTNSGAAQSQVVEADGTIKGECAYVTPEGTTIKVSVEGSILRRTSDEYSSLKGLMIQYEG